MTLSKHLSLVGAYAEENILGDQKKRGSHENKKKGLRIWRKFPSNLEQFNFSRLDENCGHVPSWSIQQISISVVELWFAIHPGAKFFVLKEKKIIKNYALSKQRPFFKIKRKMAVIFKITVFSKITKKIIIIYKIMAFFQIVFFQYRSIITSQFIANS